MNNSEIHNNWANAIGFLGFCALLAILSKSCTAVDIEREKTKQLEIIHKTK